MRYKTQITWGPADYPASLVIFFFFLPLLKKKKKSHSLFWVFELKPEHLVLMKMVLLEIEWLKKKKKFLGKSVRFFLIFFPISYQEAGAGFGTWVAPIRLSLTGHFHHLPVASPCDRSGWGTLTRSSRQLWRLLKRRLAQSPELYTKIMLGVLILWICGEGNWIMFCSALLEGNPITIWKARVNNKNAPLFMWHPDKDDKSLLYFYLGELT